MILLNQNLCYVHGFLFSKLLGCLRFKRGVRGVGWKRPLTCEIKVMFLPVGNTESKFSFYGELSHICASSCSVTEWGQICARLSFFVGYQPSTRGQDREEQRTGSVTRELGKVTAGPSWTCGLVRVTLGKQLVRLSGANGRENRPRLTRCPGGALPLTSQANSLNCSPRIL